MPTHSPKTSGTWHSGTCKKPTTSLSTATVRPKRMSRLGNCCWMPGRTIYTHELAEFDVVDIAPREVVEASWSKFIVRTHGSISDRFDHNILRRHPRRSCEAFAFATLQQAPWHEDPFPATNTLSGLDEWIRPIIAEEQSGLLAGEPHHLYSHGNGPDPPHG